MCCPLKGTGNFPQSQKYTLNSSHTYSEGLKLGLGCFPKSQIQAGSTVYYKEHLESRFECFKDNY